jgi:hypothetical protein
MTPAPVATIKRRAKAEREASFAALRAQGIGFVQALCGGTWTDHNLHDPGITILEQLCYALTELVYRADFPVADHLSGADGCIPFDTLSLHRPQDVFPCRATSAADYRRVLLDAVPGLDDAALLPLPGRAGVAGLYRLMLKLSDDVPESAEQRIALARAAYRAQRNLGEDLDAEVVLVRDRWCELHAEIEIAGPRDAAEVLAEVYQRCARFVAQAAQVRGLRELLAQGQTPEQIYSGPVMQHGVVSDEQRDEASPASRSTLYVADLAAQVRAVDGVRELRQLALQPEGGRATTGSLAWRGEGWALRLRVPGAAGDERPSQVLVRRRGNELRVTLQALRGKLDELQAVQRAGRMRLREEQHRESVHALPQGQHRPFGPYHSVQHHFPAVYGLGRHGVPASAGAMARAKAQQLKSYLLLFEQLIAHGGAQLQHLRELFSVNGGSRQSRWWQMLDEQTLPGLEALYTEPPAQIRQAVYEPFDHSPRRKSRVLDHLLALHGETYVQNSMRQFCGHLAPEEVEALLLQNKAAYLSDIVALGRHRAGGFDDAQPSWNLQPAWNVPANCSGLQRRACLLLGFGRTLSRPLTQPLRHQRLALVPAGDAAHRLDAAEAEASEAAGAPAQASTPEEIAADLRVMLARHRPGLDEALFRAAAHRDRYRLWRREGEVGAWRLALGPDERRHWWHLADFDSEAAARRAAGNLRRFLLRLHDESEGMHVVEHVLLRPLGEGGAQADLPLPAGFFALRISVVLPAWTVRTQQPAFRRFAEETLRINCPSHLALDCLWLAFDAMQRFEQCFESWLELRRAHGEGAPSLQRLDEAACRVIECLLPSPVPSTSSGRTD